MTQRPPVPGADVQRYLPMVWTDDDMAAAFVAGYIAGDGLPIYDIDDVGDEFGAWINEHYERTRK